MFLAVISSIFNIFRFSLKIWNPDNFVYLGMQCREILRIFRGRVFEIYVILTFFHHFFSFLKKIQKKSKILFPAFFCIPIAVICRKFQVSSCNGPTEDSFLSEKWSSVAPLQLET